MQPKYGFKSLCDQNCGVQSVNSHAHRHTDRKVKTEGPKIMYIYICYLLTVIIDGEITEVIDGLSVV